MGNISGVTCKQQSPGIWSAKCDTVPGGYYKASPGVCRENNEELPVPEIIEVAEAAESWNTLRPVIPQVILAFRLLVLGLVTCCCCCCGLCLHCCLRCSSRRGSGKKPGKGNEDGAVYANKAVVVPGHNARELRREGGRAEVIPYPSASPHERSTKDGSEAASTAREASLSADNVWPNDARFITSV